MRKAVLFDVDGTLLDTWHFVFDAVKYTSIIHGHSYPSKGRIKEAMGKPLLGFYKTLFPKGEHEILAKTHRDHQKGLFDLGKPFPKTKQTLKILKKKGFLVAAISNRTKKSLWTSLKTAKILEFIDIVVSAEDVKNPKPDKEHILTALKFLKAKPENCFMIGDTIDDILAGKAAGVKSVGVTYGFLGKDIKNSKPDFVIDNIEELLEVLN